MVVTRTARLGGQFGEMLTAMQYQFQALSSVVRGEALQGLLYGVGTEEIGHVELIATTIARLTDGVRAGSGPGIGQVGTGHRRAGAGRGRNSGASGKKRS